MFIGSCEWDFLFFFLFFFLYVFGSWGEGGGLLDVLLIHLLTCYVSLL